MVNHDLGIAAFAVNLGSSHVTPLRGTRSENGDCGAHEAVGHQYLDQLATNAEVDRASVTAAPYVSPLPRYVEARHQACIEAYPSPFCSDRTPEPNRNQG